MLRKGIGSLLAVFAAGSIVLAPAPQTTVAFTMPALDGLVNVADTPTDDGDSWYWLEDPNTIGYGDGDPGRNSWYWL